MAGLIGLAQLGTLEIHTWGCHADKVERPDMMVFDLDPDPHVEWDRVALAAFDVRRRLSELGFTSFVKTTGGKGLHVVVPVEPTAAWKEVKSFARGLSAEMAADAPDKYLTKVSKAERVGRIFIDYLRNDPTSTAVAPYSTRSRAGAPVATPLRWDELGPKLDPKAFTIRTVPARLSRQRADPWAEMLTLRQRLPDLPRG